MKIKIITLALFTLCISNLALANDRPYADLTWNQLVNSTAKVISFYGGYHCPEIREQVLSNINLFIETPEYGNDGVGQARSFNSTKDLEGYDMSDWLSEKAVGFYTGLLQASPPKHVHFAADNKRDQISYYLNRILQGVEKPLECN
jgi:hypothetical protein